MRDPVLEALDLARAEFGVRLAAIAPDQWLAATPCDDWTVRDLVNHVVGQEYRFADNIETNDPAWYGAACDDDFIDERLVALALPLAQSIASDPALAGMLGEPQGELATDASPQQQLLTSLGASRREK